MLLRQIRDAAMMGAHPSPDRMQQHFIGRAEAQKTSCVGAAG